MIVWLILFLIIIGISFLLAFRSMKDYQEVPEKTKLEYSLFLIRKPQELTEAFLHTLHKDFEKKGLVISLERLFKGSESALCIFGPKTNLAKYKQALDLLELEDYAESLKSEHSIIWEVGFKGSHTKEVDTKAINPFSELPTLEPHELFLWQVLLSGKKMQIRAGVSSSSTERRKALAQSLQNLSAGKLIKIPKPFPNAEILGHYKKRVVDNSSAKEFSVEVLKPLLTI